MEGIEVLGPLPEGIQVVTVFSAGRCASSQASEEVCGLPKFMVSSATAELKRRQGMEQI